MSGPLWLMTHIAHCYKKYSRAVRLFIFISSQIRNYDCFMVGMYRKEFQYKQWIMRVGESDQFGIKKWLFSDFGAASWRVHFEIRKRGDLETRIYFRHVAGELHGKWWIFRNIARLWKFTWILMFGNYPKQNLTV